MRLSIRFWIFATLVFLLSYSTAFSQSDSSKYFITVAPGASIAGRISLGAEAIVKKKIIGVELLYQLQEKSTPPWPQAWYVPLMICSGIESKFHFKYPLAKNRKLFFSSFLSYRYTHVSNGAFEVANPHPLPDHGIYVMSQTRNLIGLACGISYMNDIYLSRFEWFVRPVVYAGITKNTYFNYRENDVSQFTPGSIPEIKTWFMRGGNTVLATLDFGFSYRLSIKRTKNVLTRATTSDTGLARAKFLKIYLLSGLINRWSIGYEQGLKEGRSMELQGKVILPFRGLNAATQFFPNVAFLNSGAEISFGYNIIHKGNDGTYTSNGLYISYRYQHLDHENYWTGGISGSSSNASYFISQTKNAVGLFLKFNFFNVKKVSLDKYFMIGTYAGYARTVCFAIDGPYYSHSSPMSVLNPEGLYMPNGIYFMPELRVGFAFKSRLN
jgi:hypothetical protein